MSFICSFCNKEYCYNKNLTKHLNGVNKCRVERLEREIIILKEENNELKKQQVVNIHNGDTINNQITNQQLNVEQLTIGQYFETVPGLPRIDMDDFRIKSKIDLLTRQLNDGMPIRDLDYTKTFNTVFNDESVKQSVVIKDKKRLKTDIKYDNKVKEFNDHLDLHCDIDTIRETVANKHNNRINNLIISDTQSFNKCKRDIIKRHPKQTGKSIKNGAVLRLKSI